MASSRGFTGKGRSRARAGAPPADDGHLIAPQPSLNLNADFAAMPATELVAHLDRHRRPADFTDAAVVLADRERRLVEAERLVRARDAQLCQAARTEEVLRAQIHALQLQQPSAAAHGGDRRDTASRSRQSPVGGARHGSGTSGRGRGRGHDNVPRMGYTALRIRPEDPPAFTCRSGVGFDDTSVDASDDDLPRKRVGFDTGVQTMQAAGEVGDYTPSRTTGYKSMRMNATSPRASATQSKQPRRRRRISDGKSSQE